MTPNNDQASTLRSIAGPLSGNAAPGAPPDSPAKILGFDQDRRPRANTHKPRYIAVTSGKGGVGKSNLSVNLALELGALGQRVTLLDGDFGLGNADQLCGLSPKFHLGHVIRNAKELEDIQIELAKNVNFIPSGSGLEDLANMSEAADSYLFEKLREMEQTLDFVVIDTASGIAEGVTGILVSAEEVIVVVNPEPTSIVDAYATIKVALSRAPGKPILVVVNSVTQASEAEKVFLQLYSAVCGFLSQEIEFLGMIPRDPQVGEAVRRQVPVVKFDPDTPASRAIRIIARHIQNRRQSDNAAFSPQTRSFWEMLLVN